MQNPTFNEKRWCEQVPPIHNPAKKREDNKILFYCQNCKKKLKIQDINPILLQYL